MTLWRLDGPQLLQDAQGQVVPEYYGGVHKDVQGIPAQVGYNSNLADNCGASTTDTTLRLSGPHLDHIRNAIYPHMPTVAQIGGEWVKVVNFLDDPWRIVVQRAYSGTGAVAHEKGTEVYFIEARPIYVFASSPPGCRYPDDAVVQFRVNDVAQTPPCTIRLQDARLAPGARFVTVEFDLQRAFGGMPPVSTPTTILSDVFGPATAVAARPMSIPSATRYDLVHAGTGVRPPPPPPSPAPAQQAVGPAASTTRVIPAAPLGRVSLDLRGLVDTPAGRYTGIPSAAMDRPAAIVDCILESTYGESRRHRPTWMSTMTSHALLAVDWQVAWRGMNFPQFRALAGFNGLADLWLDDEGDWRYTFHSTAPTVATLTLREILGEVAVGFIAPSATQLVVSWGEGLTAGTFTLPSATMIERYGEIRDRALALPWIPREATARTVAAYWLPKWDRDRWTATVAVPPSLAALTRTDRVLIDTPILNPYGLVWEIRGTTDRGEQRVLTLIEGDASTHEPLPGMLRGAARATATLVGGFEPDLGGALLAQALLAGELTVSQAALLTGAAGAMATLTGTLTVPTAAALTGAAGATATLTGTLTGAPATTTTIVLPNQGNSTGITGVSSKQVTLPFPVKAGSIILVGGGVWRSTSPSPIGVTDSLGSSYAVKNGTTITDGAGLSMGFLAYGSAASDGPVTVTVTPAGGTSYITFSVHELPNAVLDVDGGESTGNSGTESDSITTTVANTIIVALHHAVGGATDFVPGAGISQLAEDQSVNNTPYALMWRRAPTATSYAMTATHAVRLWSVLTLAFKAAASTPPSAPQSIVAQGDAVSAVTLTMGQEILADQYIVVSGAIWRASDPHTIVVTDSLGHTYTTTETGAISWSGGLSRGFLAYARVTTPGALVVTVTPSGGTSAINAYAMIVHHIDPSSPVGTGPNEATGTGTAVSVGLTTTIAHTVAVAVVTCATPASTTVITEGNGYVPLFEDQTNTRNAVQVAARRVAAASSADPTFTLGTAREWRVLGLAFNPA
jgi:hypothetical protein